MKKKNIPKFKDEDQEREFWSSQDLTEYIDWNDGNKLILPTRVLLPGKEEPSDETNHTKYK